MLCGGQIFKHTQNIFSIIASCKKYFSTNCKRERLWSERIPQVEKIQSQHMVKICFVLLVCCNIPRVSRLGKRSLNQLANKFISQSFHHRQIAFTNNQQSNSVQLFPNTKFQFCNIAMMSNSSILLKAAVTIIADTNHRDN